MELCLLAMQALDGLQFGDYIAFKVSTNRFDHNTVWVGEGPKGIKKDVQFYGSNNLNDAKDERALNIERVRPFILRNLTGKSGKERSDNRTA